ncbi:MAG TPA: hypothetical protein VII33_08510 [Nakamurella sp.]
MRDKDGDRVRGMTRDEDEADLRAEREASTVRYVPMMTPERLAGVRDAGPLCTDRGA